jgi:hypothetical protein
LLILLFIINGFCLANLGTNAALLALAQLTAVFGVNAMGRRNALGEILIDGLALSQPHIEIILDRGWTLFHAGPTAGTEILIHIAGLFAHLHIKGTNLALYLFHLAVGEEIDIGMPTGIQQLRRENSDGAVVGGKGFVQLGHLAANTRQFFHQVDLDTHFGQIQGGLNAGDPTAEYHDIVTHIAPLVECLKCLKCSI